MSETHSHSRSTKNTEISEIFGHNYPSFCLGLIGPKVLLKIVGMYHSLHGTAGLQIPWMQLRGQSQPWLTGGVGVSQKFPFSSTAVVEKSLQRFRFNYDKKITMPPFQQRMMAWIYQTNFLANFLQMSPRSSNIYQCLSKLNCIAQYHIWKLPTGANCIDCNPHKAATMKANVSSQSLVESI